MKIILFFKATFLVLLMSINTAASQTASENGDNTLLTMMAQAKMTGMCGLLHQLSTFQITTKMEGGDQFVARFIRTEAARLGLSPAKLIENCSYVTAEYEINMKIIGGLKK